MVVKNLKLKGTVKIHGCKNLKLKGTVRMISNDPPRKKIAMSD